MLHFHSIWPEWLLDVGTRTMQFKGTDCVIPVQQKHIENNWTGSDQQVHFALAKALSNSPDSTLLAGFWEWLDPHQTRHPPHCAVSKCDTAYHCSIMRRRQSKASASRKFSFVRGSWLCHAVFRSRLVNRTTLIHHTHLPKALCRPFPLEWNAQTEGK